VYPDTLEIRIEEREPFAVWQHGSELTIISEKGDPIAPLQGGRHALLPLVVGPDAPNGAADFIALVRDFPEIASRVKGYVEVADRRWDLRLDNGVTIKLPEEGADVALADLMRMEKENAVLGRDIVSVDLRIADRVVVQLTPEAAEARQAALAAQGKKKPGKKA
jgi:cell division protein FtsQ